MRLNKVLFDRIKNIFDKKETLALDPEQLTLIEKEYKGFVRNGALLSAEDKDKLRLIDTELAQLSLSFGEHVLADTQAFELHLTDKKQLSGLPQTSITQAEALAKEKNKDGWVFTLDYPSYVPFVTFADDRALRKKMSLAFGKRGFQKNENNNESSHSKVGTIKKRPRKSPRL